MRDFDALAWGVKDGRKLAAPAIQIDHLRNGFGEGRWVFLNSELAADFYNGPSASTELVRSLARLALRGSEEFNVHPVFPLYFPGEPIQLEADWHSSALREFCRSRLRRELSSRSTASSLRSYRDHSCGG
jgi:hypothetical protein